MAQHYKLSIVLPFYNEEGAVESVISSLHAVLSGSEFPFEIMAVQNGSKDRTAEILARLKTSMAELTIVEVEVNQGFGYGILQGLKAATGDFVGFMPGDGQIAAEDVVRLARQIEKDGTTIGQGVRIARGDGFIRKFVSASYNLMISLLFGRLSADMNGHPKLFSRQLYNDLALQSKDSFIDAEIILKTSILKQRISSVPITFAQRQSGRSTVNINTCFEFVANLFAARFCADDRWGIHKIATKQRDLVEQRKKR
jgi:glycosyltransferase involved in cell wall biosynthesis